MFHGVQNIKSDLLLGAIQELQYDANPFWGMFATYFAYEEIDMGKQFIAGVSIHNGLMRFAYNAKAFDTFCKGDRRIAKGVVIHECMHILFKHYKRGENRNHKLFNVAADMLINTLIQSDMGITIEGGLYLPPDYPSDRVKNTESVYEWLLENKNQDDNDGNNGKCDGDCANCKAEKSDSESDSHCEKMFDNHDELNKKDDENNSGDGKGNGGDDEGDEGKIENDEDINDITVNDIVNGMKNRGVTPSKSVDTAMVIEKKQNKVNDVKRVFDSIKHTFGRTYTKPNRRHNSLKGKFSESYRINVIADVSGSLYSDLDKYMGYVVSPKCIVRCLQCDTDIRDDRLIKTVRDWQKLSKHGGGGTIIQPAIDRLIESKESQYPLIIITDGYTDRLDFTQYKGVVTILTTSTKPPMVGNAKVVTVD